MKSRVMSGRSGQHREQVGGLARKLSEIVDDWADSHPEWPAVRHAGRTVDYGELQRVSDHVADRLLASGMVEGEHVGVYGRRSVDAVIGMLAVLKAGGVYVPLDESVPHRRLQAMADDAGIRIVVTSPGVVLRIRNVRSRIDVAPAQEPAEPRPRHDRAPRDCAYVMFTSGTSGRPKAVRIPHSGVVRLCVPEGRYYRPVHGDRVLQSCGLSSDASTIEIWSALLRGACLVVVDHADVLSPHSLERRLQSEQVTVAYLTTSVFHHVARTRPEALAGLRFVSAGGEAMDPDLTRLVKRVCPGTQVVNFYGPTENSVVSTAHVVDDLPEGASEVPIGRPIPYSTCHVLRSDLTPVHAGEEGDLYVGGDGLAIGYFGDEELTSNRFSTGLLLEGERLYRTGDRAVHGASGELLYRGRRDRQIKIGYSRRARDHAVLGCRNKERCP
ncbi:MAG: amino acid adenylation domain-containing protein [Pseudonocardia sp.]